MKIFVVGGFVRDLFLGLSPSDTDFVVVGATLDDFLNFGKAHGFDFKQVGCGFPVFLDRLGREWAFARKERKTKVGYKGFLFEFDPSVTLEEDLFRRDLTINAMALPVLEFNGDGDPAIDYNHVIDPFDGRKDLNDKLLVHVSEHFAEDPVRVLRIARFAARYNFSVADSTQYLIQSMADKGELDALVPERIWSEIEKALDGRNSGVFFDVLAQTNALDRILPNFRDGWNDEARYALNASLDQWNPAEKWAMATSYMATARLNWLNENRKIPTKVATFSVKFNKASLVIRKHSYKVTPAVAETVFNMVGAFQDTSFLGDASVTSFNFRNFDLMEAFMELHSVFNRVKLIGFNNLTEHQKQNLKGREIGEAIDELRRDALNKLLN
jgi:tRNA nucleotidyltransferase (CCA-adding enzyme)